MSNNIRVSKDVYDKLKKLSIDHKHPDTGRSVTMSDLIELLLRS